MQELFSDSGLKALDAFVTKDTLFAFDFDGTLTAIVERPDDARIGHEDRGLLEALAQSCSVAVISGRSLGDLSSRLGVTSCLLVGNHGLEGCSSSQSDAKPKEICESWKMQLGKFECDPSVVLEDKGYTLSLHYRSARARDMAKSELLKRVRSLDPIPRIVTGKCVLNLIPSGQSNKGSALLALMHKVGAIRGIYVGDDDTDEDVFSLANPRIMGIRVGYEKSSSAQYFLPSQIDVRELLRRLNLKNF